MKRAYYGLDGPRVIFGLFFGAIVSFTIAISLYEPSNTIKFLLFLGFLLSAFSYLVPAILLLLSSLIGKYWQRDKLLSLIRWHGNEKVLDVGCGRGLLLIGAAKKLTTGKAIGIDIWQTKDLSGNTKEAVIENAKIEKVIDKIEVLNADVRNMPFDDNTFDVILSSMVIHNINGKDEREKALKEIIRVLKPKGTILLQDFMFTKQYEEFFRESDLKEVKLSNLQWFIFPPVRIVTVVK